MRILRERKFRALASLQDKLDSIDSTLKEMNSQLDAVLNEKLSMGDEQCDKKDYPRIKK